MPDEVTIYWRRDEDGRQQFGRRGLYYASFKGEDLEYQGTNPDEAIGWLIRETVLSGRKVVVVDLVSDEVPYVVDA